MCLEYRCVPSFHFFAVFSPRPPAENVALPANEAAANSVVLAPQAEARGYFCADSNVFDCAAGADLLALVRAVADAPDSVDAQRAFIRRIGAIFGRWQSLALSFYRAEAPAEMDGDALERFAGTLLTLPRLVGIVHDAIERLVASLVSEGRSIKSLRLARLFAVLFAQPGAQSEGHLFGLICSAASRLGDAVLAAVRDDWRKAPAATLRQRLDLLRNTLALEAAVTTRALQDYPVSRGIVVFMRLLHDINRARHAHALLLNALPPSPFTDVPPAGAASSSSTTTATTTEVDLHRYDDVATAPQALPANEAPFASFADFQVELIGEKIDLVQDYSKWRDGAPQFSFIGNSFVLDTALKAKVLHVQSLVAQREQQANAMRDAMMSMGSRRFSPYLVFQVRRDHIVEDSLDALQRASAADLRKPLRVAFAGEEGIDEGGVRKEWFQLLVKEIFDPKYGMFHLNEATRAYWFRRESDERLYFNLMGTLLGMAIYNGIILDLHFPSVVYKLLMGEPVQFDDLAEVDQSMHAGFKQLLAFEGDVADVYDRTFQAEFSVFGAPATAPLVPHGDAIALTNANRHAYVRYYARYVLIDSVHEQWSAFQRGFNLVMSSGVVGDMFVWQELKELICGSDVLDMTELERGTRYDSNYSPEHPSIKLFWKVVHALSQDEQRRFLRFATGSDRSPIGGLQNLQLVIVHQPDSDRAPSAHTCFNHFLLPAYPTEEKMRRFIMIALANDEGFGML